MAKKVPKLFTKPIKEKEFEKRFVRLIEQKSDKEYLQSIFEFKTLYHGTGTKPKGNFFVLRDETKNTKDKAQIAKLNALAKDIKSNRALPVNILPLFLVSVLAAGIVVFVTIFMNPLLEKVIEGALENVFEARVEIDNFNLNLFRFKISIGGISIADRDNPMTNIMQMNHTEIRLLPQAVLRGKIYIEEVRADSILFGAPRKTSGALPNMAARAAAKAAKPKTEMPPLVDFANFDAMAIVNSELDKLQSVKLYDEAFELYNISVEKWTGQVDATKKQVDDLQKAAESFINFNYSALNFQDPAIIQQVMQLIENGKTAYNAVNGAVVHVNGIVTAVEEDINKAKNTITHAQNAVQRDIDYLKSFVDFSSGTYKDILDPVLQQILTGAAQKYISYGRRALEVLEKVKTYQAVLEKNKKDEKKPKKVVFKGRDVLYPTRAYPFFYLGTLATDFTVNGWKTGFDLREISSDPDLIGKPTTLKLDVGEVSGEQKTVAFNGSADFRASAPRLFDATIKGNNFGFSINEGIKEVGIGGFNGAAAFTATAGGGRDGSVNVSGGASVVRPAIINPQGTIADAINQAIVEAGIIDIGFKYDHRAEGADAFSVNTNLGDLILAALKKTAQAYARQAMAEIEKALRSYITQYVSENYVSAQELDAIFAAVKGDKNALNGLQNILQGKITELETMLRRAAEEKLNEAKKRAEDEARKAAGNALQGLFGGRLPF
ncbi:hypothetical protein FACS189494_06400 [Spirochaetia bacterium]|nr:hypothetical protein FACS189494_06400 [Spirochaetia bacterium]